MQIYPMIRLTYLAVFLLFSLANLAQEKAKTVNAIIGDESFWVLHKLQPDESTEEVLRIQTHLAYVETLLRLSSTQHLSKSRQAKRLLILDLLHQYWQNGVFPSNRDYPGERRPCFIDADGNICAVGFLLAETKGRDAAKSINEKYQYDYLLDMNDPALADWADEFGLTLEECAMIQPTYGPPPPPQTSYAELKTGYGVSSGIAGGGNMAINVALLSGKASGSPGWAYAGLIGGSGQLILGLANIRKSSYTAGFNGYDTYTRYRAQNNLSYLNIAMGTATLVTSTINLLMCTKNKERQSPLNVYSYPNEANSISMGLHFSHRF